jgi:hypothetical protein
MEELRLKEYRKEFDTTAGFTKLHYKAEISVSPFIAALPGHAEPLRTIRGLAAAGEAM